MKCFVFACKFVRVCMCVCDLRKVTVLEYVQARHLPALVGLVQEEVRGGQLRVLGVVCARDVRS
jgi:hypothetical protein